MNINILAEQSMLGACKQVLTVVCCVPCLALTLPACMSEIHVLKSLTHKNVIKFYDWWYDSHKQNINFITEYFTSGTLRQ